MMSRSLLSEDIRLLAPHLGMMLEKRKEFPSIELSIDILPNKFVYEKVLKGDIDFGFVTTLIKNPALESISFCDEEFVLAGSDEFTKSVKSWI